MRRGHGLTAVAMAALVAAMALAACEEAAMRDPDRPVTSASSAVPPPGIAQGVAGQVTTPEGHPVAGARIEARSLDRPPGPVPEIAILSDAEGRFQWPLRPGRYRLAAIVDGREAATATTSVEPGRVTVLVLSTVPAGPDR
jgi:hypothetical protein